VPEPVVWKRVGIHGRLGKFGRNVPTNGGELLGHDPSRVEFDGLGMFTPGPKMEPFPVSDLDLQLQTLSDMYKARGY
jgi:hypothetical protein